MDNDSIDTVFDRSKEAEAFVTREVTREFADKPREEVLRGARSYAFEYSKLLQDLERSGGWVTYDHFIEQLEATYPGATPEDRTELARDLVDLIEQRMGQPKQDDFDQVQVNASHQRRETAMSILAQKLTNEEIEQLEILAKERISSDKMPDNFEDYKAEWIAEWIVNGVLDLPAK